MNYYGAKQLASSFRTVRKNTIRIANDVPEHSYDYKAAPDTRTIRELLTHIAISTPMQLRMQEDRVDDLSKLNFQEVMQEILAEQAKPRTKAEIVALLESAGERFATFLDGLNESFLGETVKMIPGTEPSTKTRFEMLLGIKEHEMHHRGQLMLLERCIGIVPHLTQQMQERMGRMQAQSAG